jgi:diaminohydroxyphosphoribosylaminopyrimidine deaminase / 5-amino-6-(5-phosphoribosylamino)uracil reductase
MNQSHQKYMSRCIEIAKNGLGNTKTNPLVGACIVYNDEIIGEGYHAIYGEAHAEVNAINSVKDKSLLQEATIYVSLEPCSHHGKTPPCSDLIISSGIKNVVIACKDTYSEVAGRGIEKLKNAACNVEIGILEKEARSLNKRFFTFNELKRPYITLKWAQSADGFIDIERNKNDEKKSFHISNEQSKFWVHQLRASEMGIMVGTNTVLNDNPSLDIRFFSGNNPTKIVIDRELKIPSNYHVFKNSAPLFIFHNIDKTPSNTFENVKYFAIDFGKETLNQILNVLYHEGINSILVEGGAALLNNFISTDFWDEAFVISSNLVLEKGLKAPKINQQVFEKFDLEDNTIERFVAKNNQFIK